MVRKNTYKLFSWSVMILMTFLSFFSYAQQVGPGGVGNSSKMVFWLDANQLGLSNGASVSSWTDESGNGNHAVQGDGTKQPVFTAVGSMNGFPSVTFDGSNDILSTSAISALDNNDQVAWYVVYKSSSSYSTNATVFVVRTATSAHTNTWGFQIKRENNNLSRNQHSALTSGGSMVFAQSDFSTSLLQTAKITNGTWTPANQITAKTNGAVVNTKTGVTANSFTHTSTFIGSATYKGQIAEIVAFSTNLNSAQEKILYNYLSAKYGIALSGMSIYAHGASYYHDVAGVGRDNSSNQHLSAKGTGIVSMTSASLSDGAFMMWGHDGRGTGTLSTNVPSAYASTNGVRMKQVWKVSELSETGDLTIKFDLTGIGFGLDDEYELIVDTDTNFTDAQTFSGTASGDTLVFNITGADLEDSYFFTIGSTQQTIVSIVDGQDWNQTSTWSCGCIPSADNHVIIRTPHNVTLTDDRSITNLDIETGASLTMDDGTTFTIKGDVSAVGGVSLTGANKILLNGTSAQTLDFSGTVDLDSLELNNSNGATLNSGVYSFTGAVTPTSGTLDFNNNTVVFVSDASGTASVGAQGFGSTIVGLGGTSVQRFIPAGGAGLRNVGFPFASSFKLSQWDDEIFISGPGFPDGCASSASGCYTSAKYWVSGGGNGTYASVTDLDSVINAGRGIEIYLGDNLSTFSAHTMTVNAAATLNLTESVSLSLGNGWNFIANPFLAPVDFDDFTRSGSTGNYFYVYNPDTGGFEFWDGASQSASNASFANGILSSFQGFWVFDSAGGTTLTIDQSSKKVSRSDAFFKNASLKQIDRFEVKMYNSDKSGFSSLYVVMDDTKSNLQEVPKLPRIHDAFELYTRGGENQDRMLSCVKVSSDDCQIVPLVMDYLNPSESYSLEFANMPDGVEVYLVDRSTGISRRVIENEGFEIDNGNNYDLIMKNMSSGDCETAVESSVSSFDFSAVVNSDNLEIRLDTEVANAELDIYSINGMLLYSAHWEGNPSLYVNYPVDLNTGVYLVVIEDKTNGQVVSKKLIYQKN